MLPHDPELGDDLIALRFLEDGHLLHRDDHSSRRVPRAVHDAARATPELTKGLEFINVFHVEASSSAR